MSNHLSNRWKALWDPNRYHGWGKTRNYFEGWYFKIVDPTEQYALAIIPGISFPKEGEPHAFIQVLDGKKCTAAYHRFRIGDFRPGQDKFELNLGKNYFSAVKMVLDLPGIKGTLTQKNLHAWPKMLYAPGVMGWYSFVPFMECYHGVVSVHHQLTGSLNLNGASVSFNQGIGYTEKDWGSSFPACWIWMQSNHFDAAQPVSLMVSVAKIPWLKSSFIGYLVGFLFAGKVYRFATYTGAKMKATLNDHGASLSFKDGKHRLEVKAIKAEGEDLMSPISGEMTGKVNESMQAVLEVKFYHKEDLLYEGTGRNSGLEMAGQIGELLSQEWRR